MTSMPRTHFPWDATLPPPVKVFKVVKENLQWLLSLLFLRPMEFQFQGNRWKKPLDFGMSLWELAGSLGYRRLGSSLSLSPKAERRVYGAYDGDHTESVLDLEKWAQVVSTIHVWASATEFPSRDLVCFCCRLQLFKIHPYFLPRNNIHVGKP